MSEFSTEASPSLDTTSATADTAVVPTVAAENLSRTFVVGEPVHALADVSLSLAPGSFTAVMGPSGSGKSTLLHVLGCLDRPDSGSISINGRPVADLTENQLAAVRASEIGFIFQTFNLMPKLSALENVILPTVFLDSEGAPRERAKSLLAEVGLGDRLEHTPAELSGGQRQRVAIARALVNDPPLLLADEPTGNLDSTTGELIMELLRELNADGRTILLVTHERDIAEYADRIVHMVDGHIERIEVLAGEDQ